jgi:hypothetical protein
MDVWEVVHIAGFIVDVVGMGGAAKTWISALNNHYGYSFSFL